MKSRSPRAASRRCRMTMTERKLPSDSEQLRAVLNEKNAPRDVYDDVVRRIENVPTQPASSRKPYGMMPG